MPTARTVQQLQPFSERSSSVADGRSRLRRPLVATVAALALAATVLSENPRVAYASVAGPAVVGGAEAADTRSRGTWAALLAGYLVLSALVTGGAFVLRDNFAGRSIATSAAGWGGLGVGAGIAFGAMRARGCQSADCSDEEQVAVAVGGLLGASIGGAAGYWIAGEPGLSRPYTAAAGMTPAFVFLLGGTLFEW